ncbi:hypothetical protein MUK42_36975 [Musa troglodytarum]|uniref:Uncharacterized protein n=1 Tax=Musa troglodytarum TaxID=320322 RepID=A0A9E7FNV0_9LILI|nr:hypothetical protein MUK42_36975 [Musa troglodytarum]
MWLTKVGLQAGRYSGRRRPDLNRTPQALQSVLAPSGPARHCGVFWAPQWLQRRSPEPDAVGDGLGLRPRFFGPGFVARARGGGGTSWRRKLWSPPATGRWSYMRHEVEHEEDAELEVLVGEERESANRTGTDMYRAGEWAGRGRWRLLRLAFTDAMPSVESPPTAESKEEATCGAAAEGSSVFLWD